jgi:phosphohistidine phosphatase
MKLYLMQHGEAKTKEEDPERPLTDRGKGDVGRVATCIARAGIQIDQIRHSGKRRAEDTANIVAQHLHTQEIVVAVSGINPNDNVEPIAETLHSEKQSVMLVGHLPFLSRLASYLLTGNAEQVLVQFQMGGIVCLERQGENWIIRWMVVPALVQ